MGQEVTVQVLLKNADVNAQGGRYGNVLLAAAWRGHTKTLKLLLEKGADVNAQGSIYGTALQAAVFVVQKALCESLLPMGWLGTTSYAIVLQTRWIQSWAFSSRHVLHDRPSV
ncbi:hypothetical protein N7465_007356 [Penicillium sp. CMV-2018d]|nr:hypothetical protein N7465_007356 [Penicillium sp. CMV-2018d]